jgi:general stress protein YciG
MTKKRDYSQSQIGRAKHPNKGFGSMPRERIQEIAAKGGRANRGKTKRRKWEINDSYKDSL